MFITSLVPFLGRHTYNMCERWHLNFLNPIFSTYNCIYLFYTVTSTRQKPTPFQRDLPNLAPPGGSSSSTTEPG